MVNILKLPEQALYYALTHCGMNHLSSGYSALEAAVVHKECRDPKLAQHIHKIQTAFNVANAGWLFWSMGQLIKEINYTYSISLLEQLSTLSFDKTGTNFLLATASATIGVFAAIFLLNKCFQPEQPANENASWERPVSQKLTQHLYLARIVVNVARAYFTSNYVELGISTASQLYSLLQTSQLKWLKFTRDFSWPHSQQVTGATVSYRTLLLPYRGDRTKTCSTCLSEDLDSYFCSSHAFHDDCVIEWVSTNSDKFGNADSYFRTDTFDQHRNYKYSTYRVSIEEENLPNCGYCRTRPPNAYFDIVVKDRRYGRISADVDITERSPSPPLFSERFIDVAQAAYSVFQGALTSVQQRHPKLAGTIFKVQKVLMIADAVALVENYKQLHRQMKERYAKDWPEWKVNIVAGVSAAAFAGLAALAALHLHRLLRPAIDLKEVLKNAVNLSSEELGLVNIGWNAPFLQKVGHWLYVQRIATHLALALLSSKAYLNLVSAAFQMASLLNIARLPWIQIEKNYADQRYSGLSASAHFLIPHHSMDGPSHCPDEISHLQSVLKTTYNYIATLFNDSKWKSYWLVTKRNDLEISRKLVYDITVRESLLQACKCEHLPFLGDLSGNVKGANVTNLIRS